MIENKIKYLSNLCVIEVSEKRNIKSKFMFFPNNMRIGHARDSQMPETGLAIRGHLFIL